MTKKDIQKTLFFVELLHNKKEYYELQNLNLSFIAKILYPNTGEKMLRNFKKERNNNWQMGCRLAIKKIFFCIIMEMLYMQEKQLG